LIQFNTRLKSVNHQDCDKLQRNGYLWQMLRLGLELCFEAFMRDVSVESFVIFAIVIGHEILLHPIQLPYLAITKLFVYWRCPPICFHVRGTLINACCSIPLASPCSEMMKPYFEWCIAPISFHKSASCCPVICIP